VLVVGAGISGLVCAYALRKAGIDALIVEASPRPGGMIRSEQRDGFLLEHGPQSFSGSAQIRDLCSDLGIESELLEASPRAPRFILVDRRLRQVPLSPPAFFTSSLFSFATKWGILRDVFGRSTPPETDESVAAFVRRKFSPELLDKLVAPFVSGIFAGDPEKLSLRAAFPQLYEAELASGSVVRGAMRNSKSENAPRPRPTLQSFRNGNETLVSKLASSLGPALRCGVSVSAIQRRASGDAESYEIRLSLDLKNEEIVADHLVVATPTQVSASLLSDVSPDFGAALSGIEYAPVAVVSLGYRKSDVGNSLDGFGFLVPRAAGLRVLGTVWNSSLFPGRTPEGFALLTSFVGGATNPQAIALEHAEIASMVHREISPLLAIRQPPVCSNVAIYQRALPQYNLGHSERIAALKDLRAKFPGLWLAGNYLRGPSIGACVEQTLSIAEEIRSRIP
jgi:oxygen-dependent protoporphyrinogen oxidase